MPPSPQSRHEVTLCDPGRGEGFGGGHTSPDSTRRHKKHSDPRHVSDCMFGIVTLGSVALGGCSLSRGSASVAVFGALGSIDNRPTSMASRHAILAAARWYPRASSEWNTPRSLTAELIIHLKMHRDIANYFGMHNPSN